MLRVSSLKPLASESKGLAFLVELVAPGLLIVGYLSYVHRAIFLHSDIILVTTFSYPICIAPCHPSGNYFFISHLCSVDFVVHLSELVFIFTLHSTVNFSELLSHI
ncbi:hypothetical protein H5410_020848 [Solanum commersonii]|uniref:Uncharacterized protein n=1 Tax=Solanum commersonii TaxID=4109 RepID=A0A9J5ZCB2_SOLCO|nr:hypothetical protein H5410_020848 [Solanum commersonii]